MEESAAVRSPCEVIEIGGPIYSRVALLDRRLTIQSRMNAPLIVVGGEVIQLAMQVETRSRKRSDRDTRAEGFRSGARQTGASGA